LAPNFLGLIPKKSLHSVLLPTNTHDVLKFRKDPFRGVNGISWKKSNICKTDAVAI